MFDTPISTDGASFLQTQLETTVEKINFDLILTDKRRHQEEYIFFSLQESSRVMI
jgi:hypothetical protein